jgi:MFS family permease
VSSAEPKPQRTVLVLAAAGLAFSTAQTATVPAIPEMARALDCSEADVTWTLTAYLVAASIATPVVGRLGDRHGRRRLLVVALLIFAAGSAIAALGQRVEVVVAGRVVQGAGGAIYPLCFGLVREQLPAARVPTFIGVIAAIVGLGAAVGLIVGGVLVDHVSWESIFWLGTLSALLAAVATHVVVAPSRPHPRMPRPTAGSEASRVLRITNLATFAMGFVLFGVFILVPSFAQAPEITGYGFGTGATGGGVLLVPGCLVMLALSSAPAALGRRTSGRVRLMIGAGVSAAGLLATAAEHGSPALVAAWSVLTLGGLGIALAAISNLIVEAAGPHRTAEETGVNVVVRTVGSSVGSQLIATVLAASVIAGGTAPTEDAFTTAFVLCGVLGLAALAAAGALPRSRPPRAAPARSPARDVRP